MILPYFIFTCLALCTHGIKLHEHMTKRETETTFNCDHKLVHEVDYQVIPILHADKFDNKEQTFLRSHPAARSAAYFEAFGRNISLYLLQNDNTLLGSYTPLFMAKRSRRGRSLDGQPRIIYSRMKFPVPDNLKLYHDMENRAAVSVFTDEDNKAHMYGVIGDDLIVKPIPARLHKEILPKYPELYKSSFSHARSFFGNPQFENSYKPTHHIVIKSKVQVNPAYQDPMEGSRQHLDQQWHNINSSENDLSNPFYDWKNPLQPTGQASSHWNEVNKPTDPTTQRPIGKKSFTTPIPNKHINTVNRVNEDSDSVYPELLVAVDFETYKFHGGNIKELSNYMAAFWNAVDLRFREMSHPQIRLNIAGLIVPQTRYSAPYIERGRVNSIAIEAEKTARLVGDYFFNETQFPKSMYDIVVAMSHLEFGLFANNGQFNYGTTGIANLGGACKVYQGQAIALIKDKGGFSGITTAAHELGHSMGAPHDGDDTSKLPGGPCPWSDGYLMSYERRDSRGMHWSPCSKTAMSIFLKSEEANCMRNKPDSGTPYPKILPGRLLSRDEQCKRSLGPGWLSDKEEQSNCAVLHCGKYLSATQYVMMTETKPPAEGSYCGEEAICLDAQCVKDPENL